MATTVVAVRETTPGERRVALTPDVAKKLVGRKAPRIISPAMVARMKKGADNFDR
jgi:NAD(P) transhydrogenase subunit alpha